MGKMPNDSRTGWVTNSGIGLVFHKWRTEMGKELRHTRRTGNSEPTLAEKLRTRLMFQGGGIPSTTCLLLDRTGSMMAGVGNDWSMDGPSRIEELRKLAKEFPGVRKFQYSDSIEELREGQEIGRPSGGNNEPKAFSYLKTLGMRHVLLLTDGGADDPKAALVAARGLKFSIWYIGPHPAPGFLFDLAAQSGGKFNPNADLAEMQKIIKEVKDVLLLDSPKVSIKL